MKEEGKPSILFATKARRAGAKGKEEYHCSIASFLSFFWDVWDPLLGLTISLVAFFVCRGGVVGRRRSLFFHHTLSEAEDRNWGTVVALVGAKADVNLQDTVGTTALLRAVKNWKTECRKNDSIIFVPCFTLILFHHPQPISWYPVLPPFPPLLSPDLLAMQL